MDAPPPEWKTLTFWIAAYGAIVATVAGIWPMINRWLDGRLRLDLKWGSATASAFAGAIPNDGINVDHPPWVETASIGDTSVVIFVVVRNRGRMPVTLETVDFVGPHGRWQSSGPTGGGPLPARLESEDVRTLAYPAIEADGFFAFLLDNLHTTESWVQARATTGSGRTVNSGKVRVYRDASPYPM